jgi:hypothetical protein
VARSETKKDAFRRLAAQRTNAVLERIRILGNCANSQLYEYTEEDVRKIFAAIERELRTVKARFLDSRRAEFKL